jgi:hypothetical protein
VGQFDRSTVTSTLDADGERTCTLEGPLRVKGGP